MIQRWVVVPEKDMPAGGLVIVLMSTSMDSIMTILARDHTGGTGILPLIL